MFLEIALDTHLEGHVGGWAANAGPVEADADDLVRGDPDEFDITAIGLNRRPDQVDDPCHALDERRVGLIGDWRGGMAGRLRGHGVMVCGERGATGSNRGIREAGIKSSS